MNLVPIMALPKLICSELAFWDYVIYPQLILF